MRTTTERLIVMLTPFLFAGALFAQGTAAQGSAAKTSIDKFFPVTQKDLNNPDPGDWLMLGGNMEHWNYSPLDQVNRGNVNSLQLVWARQMPTNNGRAGTSPLIHNGIMYLVSPNDVILAVDARTGSRIWEYRRPLPEIGDGPGLIHHRYSGAKRGLALYGDKIFTVSSDNVVVALNARTGEVAWEAKRGTDGYVANTSGPIIANDILIAGGSCQNAPFGCYVTGHDIKSGKELWRNEVIPHPDGPGDETWRGMPFENRWCTGVWGQIVYDPVQNLVHYGSSGICPASDLQRGVAGKNATLAGTNTRWAVKPSTGEIAWRRQLLPQDNWDQECTFEMMLVDTPMHPNPNAEGMLAANRNVSESRVRSLVGMPCKNPVFWALDAQTGKFFYARETFRGAQNLYQSIDPVSGLATMNQEMVFDRPGKKILYCTSHSGGRDAHVAPAYDPRRNIMIQATGNICTSATARDDRKPTPDFTYNVNEQQVQNPNVPLMKDGQYPVGQITAVDVATGNTVWQYQQRAYNYSAVLATAGSLVFNGDGARYFFALDTETGKKLWQVRLGSMCCGYPVTYSVDGRQYVAVVAGYGRNSLAPEIDNVTGDNMIYVFALPEAAGGAGTGSR
ncbi:MAG TPA: PQQ-binding-like beta-propeller repeat protein [Bryobacteraceae bacterium]